MKKFLILILVLLTLVIAIILIPKGESELITPTPSPVNITPSPTEDVSISPTPMVFDKEIIFSDGYLELVVRNLLKKPVGAIMQSEINTIKELNARVCAIHSIADLTHFTNIEKLDLYGNRISDISPLAGLTKLKYLDLSHNYDALNTSHGGLNLEYIKNLTALEVLYLDKNSISDISVLSGLTSLKRLSLKQNRLNDISPLYRCQQLEYLDLSRNFHIGSDSKDYGIKDLTVLSNLTKLKYVDISDNKVEDITPLSLLPNLEVLIASINEIADIEALRGNNSIVELNLEYNILFSFDVILQMNSLEKVYYNGNPILDYYPIDVFEGRITPSPATTIWPTPKYSGGKK